MMESKFWLNKWINNEIGFHRNEYNPNLEKFWPKFAKDKTTVFVPLCGKSLDMLFFNENGHKVYGVELSRIAVEAFFIENKIPYKKDGHLYYTEDLFIYCEDIFNLGAKDFRDVGYIYDRASMVALPSEMREKYVNWIKECFPAVPILLETFDFNNDEVGPPFSVNQSMIENAYSDHYHITLLQDVEIEGGVHADSIPSYHALTFGLLPKKKGH